IFGDSDRENAPLAPRHEVRGLPAIGSAGLNLVVGADGDIESLLLVSIEIANENAVRAVRILEPALVRTGHALTGVVYRFDGQLLSKDERNTKGTKDRKKHKKFVLLALSCAFCVQSHYCCCVA